METILKYNFKKFILVTPLTAFWGFSMGNLKNSQSTSPNSHQFHLTR